MRKLVVPPFHPWEVVKNATPEERRAMYEEWLAEYRRWNPGYFNADGTQKKWWQVLLGR
jgi:hypothetical protein